MSVNVACSNLKNKEVTSCYFLIYNVYRKVVVDTVLKHIPGGPELYFTRHFESVCILWLNMDCAKEDLKVRQLVQKNYFT